MSRSSHNLPRLCSMNTTRSRRRRDRHIGFLQCDHVVDAVADKADLVSFTLQFIDIISFVGRLAAGEAT